MKKSVKQSVTQAVSAVLVVASLTACGAQQPVSADGRIIARNEVLELDTTGATVLVSLSDLLGLNLGLVYDIAPPAASTTGGVQTYAADLTIANGYAYTAFNTPNAPQAGAIDAINLNLEIMNPSIVNSKTFTDFDANSVRAYGGGQLLSNGQLISGGTLWVAGSVQDVGGQFKAFALDQLTYGIGAQTVTNSLRGYAGTGVALSNQVLYVASGDNAGIDKVDAGTGAVTQFINQTDTRDIAPIGTSDVLVLSGQPGTLTRYNAAGAQVWSRALGGNSIAQSKSTLAVGTQFIAASTGDGGFKLICAADGQIAAQAAALSVAGIGAVDSVTNSVAFGPGLVITGNGEAGIGTYMIQNVAGTSPTACANISLGYMGRTAFTSGSANKVTTGNFGLSVNLAGIKTYAGRVYVASGLNGFRTVSLNFQLAAGSTVVTP